MRNVKLMVLGWDVRAFDIIHGWFYCSLELARGISVKATIITFYRALSDSAQCRIKYGLSLNRLRSILKTVGRNYDSVSAYQSRRVL